MENMQIVIVWGIACLVYLIYCIRRIITFECQEASIVEIQIPSRLLRSSLIKIRVRTYIDGKETILTAYACLDSYKYEYNIGENIPIYINPKKPYATTMTRNIAWRLMLCAGLGIILCIFPFILLI